MVVHSNGMGSVGKNIYFHHYYAGEPPAKQPKFLV
uniref:ColH n=1 Tax=Moorena bouillonii PNG TaxID=568701 RepID=A0A0H4TNS6_9CYAN|nr:ColH [Moorena bouillonii PNG]